MKIFPKGTMTELSFEVCFYTMILRGNGVRHLPSSREHRYMMINFNWLHWFSFWNYKESSSFQMIARAFPSP